MNPAEANCSAIMPQARLWRHTARMEGRLSAPFKISPHANGDAHALQVIGAQHGDGMLDAGDWKARRVEERVCDGQHFTGERGIRGDQLAQLVQLHIFIGGQLQHPDGNLWKRRQMQMGPGKTVRFDSLFFDPHCPSPHNSSIYLNAPIRSFLFSGRTGEPLIESKYW